MRQDRNGQSRDDQSLSDVGEHHKPAPVGPVNDDARARSQHQPRQALYGRNRRYPGRGMRELRRQQGKRRQPHAIPEVRQEPRQPVARERRPESPSERDHHNSLPANR